MHNKMKYLYLFIFIIIILSTYRKADAESVNNKKEINITIGKTIKGTMESGVTDTYVIKPEQIGRLTIIITNYVKDDTTVSLYNADNVDKKILKVAEYNEKSECSTARFDIYVNRNTYYLDLKNQYVINSGLIKIKTKFKPVGPNIDAEKINGTVSMSIPIENNKYYLGILTHDETENYYSISLKKNTHFQLKITGIDEADINITIFNTKRKIIHSDWCYQNTKIYTFSKPLKAGKYYINVKSGSEYQPGIRYHMETSSYIAIKAISIPSRKTLKVGEIYTFKPSLKPVNATEDYYLFSSNRNVVIVSPNTGKIKAIKKGSATITVETVDGHIKRKCKITVIT